MTESEPRRKRTSSTQSRSAITRVRGKAAVGQRERKAPPYSLKIKHKGLIVVAIPLLFSLLFLTVLTFLLRQSEIRTWQEMHSKTIIYESSTLSRLFHDGGIAMGGYALTKSPLFRDRFDSIVSSIPREFRKMQRLVGNNPRQKESLQRLESHIRNGMQRLSEAKEAIESGSGGVSRIRTLYSEMKGVTTEISDELEKLTTDSRRIEMQGPSQRQNSEHAVKIFVTVGVLINIMLTFALLYFFSSGITKRLSILTENAERLARGEALAAPLSGTDEIAHLDNVFHQMAVALEEASLKERTIVENAADVICSIDANGNFTKLSPATIKLWGYSPDELLGKSYLNLIRDEDIAEAETATTALKKGQSTASFETGTKRKDGSIVTVLWSAFWSSSEKALFCVAHDISERKLAAGKVEMQMDLPKDL